MDKQERREYEFIADQLRKLSHKFDALANGSIKAHPDDAKLVAVMARNIIQYLVAEWM